MAALDHKIDTLITHMQTLRTVFPLTRESPSFSFLPYPSFGSNA